MKSETISSSITINIGNMLYPRSSTNPKGLLYYSGTPVNLTFSNNISAVSVNVTTFPKYQYSGKYGSGTVPTTYRNHGFYYSISGNTVALIVIIYVSSINENIMNFTNKTLAFDVTGYYE